MKKNIAYSIGFLLVESSFGMNAIPDASGGEASVNVVPLSQDSSAEQAAAAVKPGSKSDEGGEGGDNALGAAVEALVDVAIEVVVEKLNAAAPKIEREANRIATQVEEATPKIEREADRIATQVKREVFRFLKKRR